MPIVSQNARYAPAALYHTLASDDDLDDLNDWILSVCPTAADGSATPGYAIRDNGDGTWSLWAGGGWGSPSVAVGDVIVSMYPYDYIQQNKPAQFAGYYETT